MPCDKDPAVEWSLGTVIVRNGDIFCSPNSKRAVSIPSEDESSINPFQTQESINYNFFQPAWWNWSCGWMAFVPLSPSFLSLPFQPLSWKPRIIETTELLITPSGAMRYQQRFTTRTDDCQRWFECEQQLARTADAIRMFYHIPGTVPPLPSSFGLNDLHRSRNEAERCIGVCRRWFVVWMGFLSYLIAQTSRPEYQKPSQGLLPGWYKRLLEKDFPPPWLDGLAGSSVCAFDSHTVRAGVILSFTDNDQHRPPAQWFLTHRVSCWYPLTRFTEEYMKRDSFLRKLIPPPELLQAELTKLFAEPRLPLALFIFKKYSGFEWKQCNEEVRKIINLECATSAILDMCSSELLKRRDFQLQLDQPEELHRVLHEMKHILAEREAKIFAEIQKEQICLEEGMVERDDFEGATSLHSSWLQFFEKRARREVELLVSESDGDRHARLQRERDPPIKKSKMFVWQTVKTSGGGIIYARTLMKQKEHEDLIQHYRPSETKFNARSSEWDFFEDFDTQSSAVSPSDDSSNASSSQLGSPLWTPASIDPNNSDQRFSDAPMQPISDNDPLAPELHASTAMIQDDSPQCPIRRALNKAPNSLAGSSTSADTSRTIETAHWQFGFMPSLGKEFESSGMQLSWKEVLQILGSTGECVENVGAVDKMALRAFFTSLVGKEPIPHDLDDLSARNHSYLISRVGIGSLQVLIGERRWFIFLAPRSATSSWFLGVDSTAAALYVLRILATTRRSHTLYTLGNLLLQHGVRFRTFEKLPKAECRRLWEPFQPQSYRKNGYKFTVEDFRASLLRTRYLLQTLPGRAALLSGGIIGRIAREFLQPDEVLDGPSVEATFARNGLCVDAEDGKNEYWDDDLTEKERAIICGTYIMYTRPGQFDC